MSLQSRDSVEKNLTQISIVARNAFTYNDTEYTPPSQGFVVSPSFWRGYKCHLGCGGCCAAYTMDFLPSEYYLFAHKYPQYAKTFKQRKIVINNKSYFVYSANLDNKKSDRCIFLNQENGACLIHEYNPLSCSIELIKLKRIKDKGYIQKTPYGYAYRMKRVTDKGKVLCEFCEFDESQFLNQDIPTLKRLERWADYFEIETRLSDLVLALTAVGITKNYQPYIKGKSKLELGTIKMSNQLELF